jgi:hypothetical protein
VISGTLIAPYLALVVTLIYYRLTDQRAPGASPWTAATETSTRPDVFGGDGDYGGETTDRSK